MRHTENSHCRSWNVCGGGFSGTEGGKTALVVVRRPSSAPDGLGCCRSRARTLGPGLVESSMPPVGPGWSGGHPREDSKRAMLSLRPADPQGILEPKRQRNIEKEQTRRGQTRPDQTENSRSCSWNVCNFVFSGTGVGKKTPCSRRGRLRNHPGGPRHGPRRFPSRPQTDGSTYLSVGPRRPLETKVLQACLVTTAGVWEAVAPDTTGPGNRYRGVWARDAADAAGLGSNRYRGSREGFPQTPRGLVTLINGGRRGAG